MRINRDINGRQYRTCTYVALRHLFYRQTRLLLWQLTLNGGRCGFPAHLFSRCKRDSHSSSSISHIKTFPWRICIFTVLISSFYGWKVVGRSTFLTSASMFIHSPGSVLPNRLPVTFCFYLMTAVAECLALFKFLFSFRIRPKPNPFCYLNRWVNMI